MEDFTRELTPGNTKAAKKQATAFYDAALKVQADPGFAGLSEEVRSILAELLQGLKKPVDEDK